MKQRVEAMLPLAGNVRVVRSRPDDQGGFVWTITFHTATDVIPPMLPHSALTGLDARVRVETLQQGNTVGGHFQVKKFCFFFPCPLNERTLLMGALATVDFHGPNNSPVGAQCVSPWHADCTGG